MVQQLHIRAAQASALLTTNKRYLSHIFIHGVKGSYETMNNWLSILLNNIDEIAALLLKDVKVGINHVDVKQVLGKIKVVYWLLLY